MREKLFNIIFQECTREFRNIDFGYFGFLAYGRNSLPKINSKAIFVDNYSKNAVYTCIILYCVVTNSLFCRGGK